MYQNVKLLFLNSCKKLFKKNFYLIKKDKKNEENFIFINLKFETKIDIIYYLLKS